ncbi:MAG: cobalamin-independent methionine synthase II family protein, partial [Rhodospirillales bacterium]|nr:cobalamin-independent methionine synthase II family protein [Rhodospirillales bacterium]
EALFVRAAKSVIDDQTKAGIDIVTDGEVRRENYIHYHCRHLDGIDFNVLTEKDVRGVYSAHLPTITGHVKARAPFLPHDWKAAQGQSDRPVKVTLPGPMTIGDTVADEFYGDPKKRGAKLASAINKEVLALAEAGCQYIQIDEPLFARKVDEALDFGFDNLEACFHNCPDNVVRTVHMCCGYPDRLDNPEYLKAPQDCYFKLAEAIDRSCIQAVSVEDAHRPNDLSLLEMFTNTTVIFGVVAIAKSQVETVDAIESRLRAALEQISPDRLMAAPDCGLGFLGRDLAVQKLSNLCEAASRI